MNNNTAVAEINRNQVQTAHAMREHVNRVQEVMEAVMKEGTHYGKIPGTPKPSLWKPGAEVLGATFHIASSYRTEDLSGTDFIRYRVTCVGTHQGSGIVLGEGMGECSSNEEKYKWRKCYPKEFDAADTMRRRIKFTSDAEIRQVRTEAADIANTILKMACKRAQVAMMLNTVAASDIFTQDIEDLPEHLRDEVAADSKAPTKPASNEKKPWPADRFALKKDEWKKAIDDKKTTAKEILGFLESKFVLTNAQHAAITELEAAPPENHQ